MATKDQLRQEIESLPDALVAVTLDFIQFIKNKHQRELSTIPTELSYRPASGRSLLEHAGTWQGDDFEDCLHLVYETRSKANVYPIDK
jgi:hypothetical protein